MTRLTKDLHPFLTLDVLDSLFKKSIFTTIAFVRKKNALLVNITGLQYDQIRKIKDKILSQGSSPLRRADKYYQYIVKNSLVIASGIEGLDGLLNGGFVTGNIYEFCGLEACGKTQLCMSLALRICQTTNHQVFFIDTKYDISAERLLEMFTCQNEAGEISTLEKIKICHSTTACKLLNDLHCLKAGLLEAKEKYLGFKFVIVDSLSVLFQSFYNINEGLSVLNNIANILIYLASEYHLVMVITNFVSSWTPICPAGTSDNECVKSSVTPALGKYWTHVPTTRINIERIGCLDRCLLTVIKSQCQEIGKSAEVQMSDAGVS